MSIFFLKKKHSNCCSSLFKLIKNKMHFREDWIHIMGKIENLLDNYRYFWVISTMILSFSTKIATNYFK